MTVRLKAIKNMVYAGRRVALGQEFDARGESDAQILTAIRSAERVTVAASVLAPKSAPTYKTRMMVAEAPRAVASHEFMQIVHIDATALDNAPDEVAKSADIAPDEVAAILATHTVGDAQQKDVYPESDIDAMDRPALFDLAVSMGLKPHHLMGAAKLRTAIRAAQ